jgi:hypothetical protein
MATDFSETDVKQGRALVEKISTSQLELGELADKVEKNYGDDTLGEFAHAIGIEYDTLKGYRYVWRKWKESAVKPRNFSLAKALASYKDKDSYIQEWPNASEKKAREDVKKAKAEAKSQPEGKGEKLPSMEKLAERLILEMEHGVLEKWQHHLDILSQRRDQITGVTRIKLLKALDKSAETLMRYKDKFKASDMLLEHEEA